MLYSSGFAELVELSREGEEETAIATRVKDGLIYGGAFYVPELKQWGWRAVDGTFFNAKLLENTVKLIKKLNKLRPEGRKP